MTVAVFRFSLWHREGVLTSDECNCPGNTRFENDLEIRLRSLSRELLHIHAITNVIKSDSPFCTSDADLQLAISNGDRMYVFATKYVPDRPAAAPRSPSIDLDLLPHEFFLFLQKLD